jgi:hypothetical protein
MYIDKDEFTAWMERIMDRFDMQDKKIDRVINGRNCLDGEELLDNQDLCLLLKVADPLPKKGNTPFPYAGWQVLLPCYGCTQVNSGENRLIFSFLMAFNPVLS